MRTQEFTGKTTQEAIESGLSALGVTIADVHVDVLQEGAKGLFGLFGSKPARVRLTVMEEEREDDHGLSDLLGSFSLNEQARRKSAPKAAKPAQPRQPKAEKPAPKAEPAAPKAEKPEVNQEKPAAPKAEKPEVQAEAPAPKAETEAPAEAPKPRRPRQPRPAREKAPRTESVKAEKAEKTEKTEKNYEPMTPAEPFTPTEPPVMHDENTPAGRAQQFLMNVTERMNVKVDVYVDDSKEDSLYIHMIGDTLGILIGRRGETLDALQYLTSLQVNKGRDGYIRVTLDTENYRAKREDSLRRLAQRMANRAQKTGRKVVLEPMNPYERRVLHTALQNHPAVTTHSEGEEPNRRVVIMLKNQPERSGEPRAQGEKPQGDKPSSSRRSRSRRRGPRRSNAPDAPVAENTAAVEAPAATENTAAAETPAAVHEEVGVEE